MSKRSWLARVLGVALLGATVATGPSAGAVAQAPERIVFRPPAEVTLVSGMGALRRTTPAFRKAVHRELVRAWRQAGSRKECRDAPTVMVQEFRRSGFAFAGIGVYGSAACAGGGYAQFFVLRDGRWRTPMALGGQEALPCATLERFGVPRMTGATTCWDESGEMVRHDPAASAG